MFVKGGQLTKFAVIFILVPEDGRKILKWVSSKYGALMCNRVSGPKYSQWRNAVHSTPISVLSKLLCTELLGVGTGSALQ